MDFTVLLNKFAVFVLLMLTGYFYARKKLVTADFSKGASRLVIEVFMSATIINSVLSNPPTLSGAELLKLLGAMSALLLILYLVSGIIIRTLRLPADKAPLLELLISVPNNMFIALPVLQQVLGNEAVFYVAMSNIPYNILLYTYGVARLRKGSSAALKVGDILSVPLIATLASLLIFMLNIDMPQAVHDITGTISGATMPLSMLVIGTSLGSVKLREAFTDKYSYLVSAVRLIIAPLAVYFLMGLFITDTFLLTVLTVTAACPSGIIITVLGIRYGHDAVMSSKATLTSTALSMLTIPALIYLLMG